MAESKGSKVVRMRHFSKDSLQDVSGETEKFERLRSVDDG